MSAVTTLVEFRRTVLVSCSDASFVFLMLRPLSYPAAVHNEDQSSKQTFLYTEPVVATGSESQTSR